MGATASFYLLAGDLLADLHEAATPRSRTVTVKRLFFNSTKTVNEDSFLPFITQKGKKVSSAEGSGYSFSSLDRLLVKRGVHTIFSSTRLARKGAAIGLFDSGMAEALSAKLKELKLTQGAVEEFLLKQTGHADRSAVLAVFEAYRQMQDWLPKVKAGSVGVLSIEISDDPA